MTSGQLSTFLNSDLLQAFADADPVARRAAETIRAGLDVPGTTVVPVRRLTLMTERALVGFRQSYSASVRSVLRKKEVEAVKLFLADNGTSLRSDHQPIPGKSSFLEAVAATSPSFNENCWNFRPREAALELSRRLNPMDPISVTVARVAALSPEAIEALIGQPAAEWFVKALEEVGPISGAEQGDPVVEAIRSAWQIEEMATAMLAQVDGMSAGSRRKIETLRRSATALAESLSRDAGVEPPTGEQTAQAGLPG